MKVKKVKFIVGSLFYSNFEDVINKFINTNKEIIDIKFQLLDDSKAGVMIYYTEYDENFKID